VDQGKKSTRREAGISPKKKRKRRDERGRKRGVPRSEDKPTSCSCVQRRKKKSKDGGHGKAKASTSLARPFLWTRHREGGKVKMIAGLVRGEGQGLQKGDQVDTTGECKDERVPHPLSL